MKLSHYQVANLEGVANAGGRAWRLSVPSRTLAALLRTHLLRVDGPWIYLTPLGEVALAAYRLGQERRIAC